MDEEHEWRKPAPGMVFAARDEFGLELDGAFFIGDKDTDMECAHSAGVRALLVYSGVSYPGESLNWGCPPEKEFPTLLEAARWIVSKESGRR